MVLSGYDFAPAAFGFCAGIATALALRIGSPDLALPGLPVIAAGWMAGILSWFVAFQLSQSLSLSPGLWFKIGSGLATGLIGGALTGLALRMSRRGFAVWAWALLALAGGALWAGRHYALFALTRSMGRDLALQNITRSQMDRWLLWLDMAFLGLVGGLFLWLTFLLWHRVRLPRLPRRRTRVSDRAPAETLLAD